MFWAFTQDGGCCATLPWAIICHPYGVFNVPRFARSWAGNIFTTWGGCHAGRILQKLASKWGARPSMHREVALAMPRVFSSVRNCGAVKAPRKTVRVHVHKLNRPVRAGNI